MEQEKVISLLNSLVHCEQDTVKCLKKYFIIHSINLKHNYKLKKNKEMIRYNNENFPYNEFWSNFSKALQNNPNQVDLVLPGLELLECNLKILKHLCNPIYHAAFNQVYNKYELMQLLKEGNFSGHIHLEPLFKLLNSICAPIRDKKITKLRRLITKNSNNLIEILRKIYNVILCLIIDMANFHMDSINTYMVQNPNNTLEIDHFLDFYGHDIQRLTKTIKAMNDFAKNVSLIQVSSPSYTINIKKHSLNLFIQNTLISLLMTPNVSMCIETWLVDYDMIEHINHKLEILYYYMGIKSLSLKYSQQYTYPVDELLTVLKKKFNYSLQLSTTAISIENVALECLKTLDQFQDQIPNYEILVNSFKLCHTSECTITKIYKKRVMDIIKNILDEDQLLPHTKDSIIQAYSEHIIEIFDYILLIYKHHKKIFVNIYLDIENNIKFS